MTELRRGDIFEQKFRIDAVLGEGGFAVVYAATDVNLLRRVAIKVIRTDTDSAEVMGARFQREIRALGQLRDPHTVRLYENGITADGRHYLVFELVAGRDLSAVLEEAGQLPPPVVEHILRQLLASLREAHQAGVLHRDIKPENVRVFEVEPDPWAHVSCRVNGGDPLPGTPRRELGLIPQCDGTAPDFPTAATMWAFFDRLDPLE